MRFYADLHLHGRFSIATSKSLNFPSLFVWAKKKGLTVVGTGDIVHPKWREEAREYLIPSEEGLYQLNPEIEARDASHLRIRSSGPVRFLLTTEISTIYSEGGRVRKVHHLVCLPSLEAADRLAAALARVGNIHSDGRPILGIDSRNLLEIVLSSDDGAFLIPAHIWTPWFSVLGSKSGFSSIEECYKDLTQFIFAIETGLSSDPAMNWRVSSLDRFAIISNSDAHSAKKLGREANILNCALNYPAIRQSLGDISGSALEGTIELFPEEGKYHLDGHRKCGSRMRPEETREHGGICPVCGKPVTIGVMNRVLELADRPAGWMPPGRAPFTPLLPLDEILSQILGKGVNTKAVAIAYEHLLATLGPELLILTDVAPGEIEPVGGDLLAQAIVNLRAGNVTALGGYDGQYGEIRVDDRREKAGQPISVGFAPQMEMELAKVTPAAEEKSPSESQRQVMRSTESCLFIIAGPGSGKTRLLTTRMADKLKNGSQEGGLTRISHQPSTTTADMASPASLRSVGRPRRIAEDTPSAGLGRKPCGQCHLSPFATKAGEKSGLVAGVTFTRAAARELHDRLAGCVAGENQLWTGTLHQLCYELLRFEQKEFSVYDDIQLSWLLRWRLAEHGLEVSLAKARKLVDRVSRHRSGIPVQDEELPASMERLMQIYKEAKENAKAWDYDDLIDLALEKADSFGRLGITYLFVDEFQDLDSRQYRLVKRLAEHAESLMVIGDPYQAIYGFRGAQPWLMEQLITETEGARRVELSQSYRCPQRILDAANAVVGRETPMKSLTGREGVLEIQRAGSPGAEARMIATKIKRIMGGTSMLGAGSEGEIRGVQGFSDVAILVRTVRQMKPLRTAFEDAGIPYRALSVTSLSHDLRFAKLFAWLQLALDPHNLAARLVLSHSGASPLELSPSLRSRLALIREKTSMEALKELEVWHEEELSLSSDEWMAMQSLAETYPILSEFTRQVSHDRQVGILDRGAEAVRLLTIHASKGLEFGAVFVAGFRDDLLPLKGAALDEERRLCYVALTRAKYYVGLSWSGAEGDVSRFVTDMPAGLLERARPARRRGVQLELDLH